jgi:Cellulase (glycosyl hydrolase family 5)
VRARATIAALVAALAAALALPGAAGAARGMEFALQDDPVFVDQAYYDRERAFEQARALGVTWIRANVSWSSVIPPEQALATTAPVSPAYDWSKLDSFVDAARAQGIRVQLTLTGPAPAYGTSNRRVGVFGVKAKPFGAFVRHAVTHFKGRVSRYSIWNEPNHVGWLEPRDLQARLYRAMYRAAYTQLKRADRRAKIFIGETSPFSLSRNATAPLRFLRELTCTVRAPGTRSGLRPHARNRGCKRLVADGYAHHPYDFRHSPGYKYRGSDNATLGTLGRLTSTLNGLARARALSTPGGRPLDVYLTEYGYFANGENALGEDVRSRYLAVAYRRAERNPRVRQMLQYTFVTPPENYPGGFFDMSVVDPLGQELGAYFALQRWAQSAKRRR